MDGLPRWKVVGKEAPGTTALSDVEDGVEDLTKAVEAGTSVGIGSRKVELQAAQFGV